MLVNRKFAGKMKVIANCPENLISIENFFRKNITLKLMKVTVVSLDKRNF